LIELYACDGNLANRPALDGQLVSTVQIWALVNLNKEKKGSGGGKRQQEF
jgi:hypothetical protein